MKQGLGLLPAANTLPCTHGDGVTDHVQFPMLFPDLQCRTPRAARGAAPQGVGTTHHAGLQAQLRHVAEQIDSKGPAFRTFFSIVPLESDQKNVGR